MAKSKSLASAPVAAHNPPSWIPFWFVVSSLVVFWDAGYCLSRPHSFEGGKWHHLWSPYALYQITDLVYGPGVFEAGEGFTSAQSILNILENIANFTYVYLWRQGNPVAPLVGLLSATATFWKTALYWLMDQQSGWAMTGHNTRWNWWVLFAVPNGFWLVVPLAIIWVLASEVAGKLRVASGAKAKRD